MGSEACVALDHNPMMSPDWPWRTPDYTLHNPVTITDVVIP
jgi:hypothetical protein